MTTIDMQLNEKQNVINGKMTQAKGVMREQLGNLQNDELTRLAGKKDQIVGHLQANYGNSWLARHRSLVSMVTAIATIVAAVAFIFIRNQKMANAEVE